MKEIKLLNDERKALVDNEDFERINFFRWRVAKMHSGERIIMEGATIYMSRVVLEIVDPTIIVDHKNANTFDNQRQNLRIATPSQSMMNRKGWAGKYKGVTFWKTGNKWRARIDKDHKQVFLGYFNTPEEAAKAYDKAAKELHGEYARLNFSEE